MSSTLLTKLSSPEEVKEYLLKKGITEKICEDFYNNDICGQAFFNLTESDLKEMVPSIGVRTKVREILKEHRKVIANCPSCTKHVVNIGNFIG